MGIGAVAISPAESMAILLAQLGLDVGPDTSPQQQSVLTAIRLPRVLASALVGAVWGAAGVAMQGLYRTPLADPALVGIGGAAALGAALGTGAAITLGVPASYAGTILVVVGAVIAALAAAAIVYRVAASSGRVVVATMLLAGIALSAFFAALTALVVTAGRGTELGTISFWALGSFSGIVGADVVVGVLLVAPAVAMLARLGPGLDALALGEREAVHLGVDVRRLGLVVSSIFALLTGVAVAIAGVVAFVALLVPTLARAWVGPAHRGAVIGSALLGATLLVVADVLARSLYAPLELPVGVITTLVGAPVFLWLVLRERGLLAR